MRRPKQGTSTGGARPSIGVGSGPFAGGNSSVRSPRVTTAAAAAADATASPPPDAELRWPACTTTEAAAAEGGGAEATQAVLTCDTVNVGTAGSMREALELLRTALDARSSSGGGGGGGGGEVFASGVLRLEATVQHRCSALDWLRKCPQRDPQLLPRAYYKARTPPLVPVDAPGQVLYLGLPAPSIEAS
jgi:hypothetical protein